MDKGSLFDLRSGGGQMRTSRFTDEQIIAIVREYAAGEKLTELCRRYNVSPTMIYK
jgi:putative transposase